MGGGQRHPQAGREQHHHYLRGMGKFGEKFGVSGKWNARVVDDCFIDGAGDHGGAHSVLTGARSDAQAVEDIGGIGGIEPAAAHRLG